MSDLIPEKGLLVPETAHEWELVGQEILYHYAYSDFTVERIRSLISEYLAAYRRSGVGKR